MKVETFKIHTDDELKALGRGGSQEQQPFIRISDCGCGIPRCGCSPDRFVSVSDGHSGITLVLTEKEFEVTRQAFRLSEVWVNLVAEEKEV